jgi:hypothetical protein
MELSTKTRSALKKYGISKCQLAHKLSVDNGRVLTVVAYKVNLTKGQTTAAINAYSEYKESCIVKFKSACENEVKELAKLMPIICPIFKVMNENINDCFDNMSVTYFVDMCFKIAKT